MRRIVLFILAVCLFVPAAAFAAGGASPPLLVGHDQLIAAALGLAVPAITYVLNHFAPWTSEAIKGTVLAVVAAVVGGVYQAIDNGIDLSKWQSWEVILTTVFIAFAAHHGFYKPTGLNTRLGGGRDHTPRK